VFISLCPGTDVSNTAQNTSVIADCGPYCRFSNPSYLTTGMERFMVDLIADSAEAQRWVSEVKGAHSGTVFGKLRGGVIWSDATGQDGEWLVPVDPSTIVDIVNNADGMKLLKGHDPGFPLGKIVAAAHFTTSTGRNFVAAVYGFYDGKRLSFGDLNVDVRTDHPPAAVLPAVADYGRIDFGFDAREFQPQWVEDTLRSAPIIVRRVPLSNNAAEISNELLIVGVCAEN
jgi:hypothetical protein